MTEEEKAYILSGQLDGFSSLYPFLSRSMKVSSISTPGYGFPPVAEQINQINYIN